MADDVFREAQRLAEQHGWTYVRRAKHGFIFRRRGQFTSMSTSPGDRRALCRVSSVSDDSVNVVAPASLVRWFTVRRSEWPAELPLEPGRYFHAQVTIGAERRRDMTMSGPYEVEDSTDG